MRALHARVRAKVRAYYSGTIERHGPTPLGVDWPNAASQYLRFVQLLRICDFTRPFSLNDLGCGYGALLEFLAIRHPDCAVRYRGIDISPSMVEAGRKRWKKHPNAAFAVGSKCLRVADYSLASGIFNVRLGQPIAEWESYVEQILLDLERKSRLGFAVNFMLPHDAGPTEEGLYRTRVPRWTEFCRKQLDCEVKAVKGYGLREFTLLARRKHAAGAPEAARRRPARRSPR